MPVALQCQTKPRGPKDRQKKDSLPLKTWFQELPCPLSSLFIVSFIYLGNFLPITCHEIVEFEQINHPTCLIHWYLNTRSANLRIILVGSLIR